MKHIKGAVIIWPFWHRLHKSSAKMYILHLVTILRLSYINRLLMIIEFFAIGIKLFEFVESERIL